MKISTDHTVYIVDNYKHQDILLKKLGNYFENYKDCQNRETNVQATMTEWNLNLEDQDFINLKNDINDLAGNLLNLFYGRDHTMESIWANIYRKGDYTIDHDHDPFRYSFVYFLKSKPNFSPLIFEDFNFKKKKPQRKIVKPIEGRIVIFPGFLTHSVPIHIHDETRITISGNFKLL